MTWPTASLDTTLAAELAAEFEAMPEWEALDPLLGAVATYVWPDTMVAGPRACILAPLLTVDANSCETGWRSCKVGIEVHVPVDAAPALAAIGSLRDAVFKIHLDGVRILRVSVEDFERGKYTSATASASLGGQTLAEDGEPMAWSRASAVAYKATLLVNLVTVRG